jgi:hypothetical protein
MLRKLGLAVSYFIAIAFIISILLPAFYCLSHHGCRGPAELDAFMPAFLFTPLGAIATAISLHHTLQQIKQKKSPWAFWPLAILFSTVLLGVFVLVAWIVYETAAHRGTLRTR